MSQSGSRSENSGYQKSDIGHESEVEQQESDKYWYDRAPEGGREDAGTKFVTDRAVP
ncbi:MAG: hypothetical protein JJ896_13085 [Rhodothermales bacterium]|nr:hypothetical protein [Rhodothermales bacterium]MBO6780580.1 hypothetical protein [Rhodothermales bacterium]